MAALLHGSVTFLPGLVGLSSPSPRGDHAESTSQVGHRNISPSTQRVWGNLKSQT